MYRMRFICLSFILLWQGSFAPRPIADPSKHPLCRAANDGNVEEVDRLISEGEEIDRPGHDGIPALHWAARNGHVEVVELLIKRKGFADAPSRGGATALQSAIFMGHTGTSKILLDAFADPTRRAVRGDTPTQLARINGNKELVKLLKKYVKEKKKRDKEWDEL
eukprot:gnl/MRDRNA2_/MRDRNA2_136503_c0_seq1.p1 gnl/MRDRNA2_/MRDRNA2_136503_c0~~gnl/MRDRNA2_/MRDRNA2_136503_c0_seq1.p1  ORF type:complete len:164 (+),score=34.91 gnl/MRDRNA2_/MRDRNA2_136503_c0_seq1:90-581(+)